MNKKGFTLAELLAIIVVISIISLIAVPALINSIKNNDNDSYESIINNIILSAETYASNASGTLVQVSVSTLQDAGYLAKKITNPIDNSELKGCVYIASGKGVYKEEDCKTVITGIGMDNICNYALGTSFPYTYDSSKPYYTFNVPCTGNYKVELWGASGGGTSTKLGGAGAYTSGIISLVRNDNLYVYVGSSGNSNATVTNVGGYNGGGYSGNDSGSNSYGGGGATDIRLVSGLWNDFNSLKSRIMVAAGGGGNISNATYSGVAGAGGGLIGYDGRGSWTLNDAPTGGTQISGGTSYQFVRDGSFGYAPQSNTSGYGGGGGSGYYGGANGHNFVGSGGSSYISGHTGSISITENSIVTNIHIRTDNTGAECELGTTDNLCSEHYSKYKFYNTIMIDGLGYNWTTFKGEYVGQIEPNGTEVAGHMGDGYARITLVSY